MWRSLWHFVAAALENKYTTWRVIYHFFFEFLPAPTRLFKFHEEKDVMYFVCLCTRVLRTVPDTQKFLLKECRAKLFYFSHSFFFVVVVGGWLLFVLSKDWSTSRIGEVGKFSIIVKAYSGNFHSIFYYGSLKIYSLVGTNSLCGGS